MVIYAATFSSKRVNNWLVSKNFHPTAPFFNILGFEPEFLLWHIPQSRSRVLENWSEAAAISYSKSAFFFFKCGSYLIVFIDFLYFTFRFAVVGLSFYQLVAFGLVTCKTINLLGYRLRYATNRYWTLEKSLSFNHSREIWSQIQAVNHVSMDGYSTCAVETGMYRLHCHL